MAKLLTIIWAIIALLGVVAVLSGAWWHIFTFAIAFAMFYINYADYKRERDNETLV